MFGRLGSRSRRARPKVKPAGGGQASSDATPTPRSHGTLPPRQPETLYPPRPPGRPLVAAAVASEWTLVWGSTATPPTKLVPPDGDGHTHTPLLALAAGRGLTCARRVCGVAVTLGGLDGKARAVRLATAAVFGMASTAARSLKKPSRFQSRDPAQIFPPVFQIYARFGCCRYFLRL